MGATQLQTISEGPKERAEFMDAPLILAYGKSHRHKSDSIHYFIFNVV
jgi:hypothetical protein